MTYSAITIVATRTKAYTGFTNTDRVCFGCYQDHYAAVASQFTMRAELSWGNDCEACGAEQTCALDIGGRAFTLVAESLSYVSSFISNPPTFKNGA